MQLTGVFFGGGDLYLNFFKIIIILQEPLHKLCRMGVESWSGEMLNWIASGCWGTERIV